MTDLDKQHDEIFRKAQASQNQNTENRDSGLYATANAPQQIVNQSDGPSRGILLTLAIVGLVLGALGFLASIFAWQLASSSVAAVASSAEAAGRAAAKAETATARANVAEIYAKQIYTELNRLGYPVKTPAEDHEPQPPEPVK